MDDAVQHWQAALRIHPNDSEIVERLKRSQRLSHSGAEHPAGRVD
jgi:hypothetical protein